MGQILIRNLDDAVIQRHRRRARRKGISLEQHLRDLIAGDAQTISKEEWLKELEELRSRNGSTAGGPDSVELIHEGRKYLDEKWNRLDM